MNQTTFRLPKDSAGNIVQEDYLRHKYRLPSNTKVRRNLAIRFWYRSGMRVADILKEDLCKGLKTPQAIYGILTSPAYKYMEEEYGLL